MEMLQEIVTLIIIIAAVSYTIIQTVKLFRKPNTGKMEMDCFAGCSSCLKKKKLDHI